MSSTVDAQADATHDLLRQSAQRFAQQRLHPGRLRELRDAPLSHSPSLWQEMALLGWAGLWVDAEHGGSDLGLPEMVIVAEAAGSRLAPEPLVACATMAARVLGRADPGELRSTLLQGLAAGDTLPALAWPQANPVTAEAGRLRGTINPLRPGESWSGLLVPVHSSQGLQVCWLPRGTPGLQIGLDRLADGTVCAQVGLADVPLQQAQVLAGAGPAALAEAVDAGRIALAAELLGLVRGAMAITLEHLRTRRQFGAAIGSFQALRHRMVDLLLQQELCAAAVALAAADFELTPPQQRAAMAARVKARAADAALKVTKEAVQMHGAMGYTDECDIGLYLKRALALAPWLGQGAALRAAFVPGREDATHG